MISIEAEKRRRMVTIITSLVLVGLAQCVDFTTLSNDMSA